MTINSTHNSTQMSNFNSRKQAAIEDGIVLGILTVLFMAVAIGTSQAHSHFQAAQQAQSNLPLWEHKVNYNFDIIQTKAVATAFKFLAVSFGMATGAALLTAAYYHKKQLDATSLVG